MIETLKDTVATETYLFPLKPNQPNFSSATHSDSNQGKFIQGKNICKTNSNGRLSGTAGRLVLTKHQCTETEQRLNILKGLDVKDRKDIHPVFKSPY